MKIEKTSISEEHKSDDLTKKVKVFFYQHTNIVNE